MLVKEKEYDFWKLKIITYELDTAIKKRVKYTNEI